MSSPVEFWSGQSRGWRYLAQRIDGSGAAGTFLDNELPLRDVAITDVLSGPLQFSASISPVLLRLLGPDGLPLLGEWSTAIYAEADGVIRAGSLLVDSMFTGPEWQIEGIGFSGYAKGMGYEGASVDFYEADPLDVIRHAWSSIQAGTASNLGLILDTETRTDRRVGTRSVADPDGDGPGREIEAAPYSLNALNDDLGEDIDALAKDHGIDYHERHEWNADKSSVNHFLDFGYPRLGRRRDLRFVLGENVQTMPQAARSGSSYANHVRFLGAGEGSAMVRAEARVADGRLRRMITLDDKDVTSIASAQLRARAELSRRLAFTRISSVLVRNTPSTPLGSWNVGDEIRIQGRLDWIEVDYWFRVLSITISPDDPEIVSMSIRRADA